MEKPQANCVYINLSAGLVSLCNPLSTYGTYGMSHFLEHTQQAADVTKISAATNENMFFSYFTTFILLFKYLYYGLGVIFHYHLTQFYSIQFLCMAPKASGPLKRSKLLNSPEQALLKMVQRKIRKMPSANTINNTQCTPQHIKI